MNTNEATYRAELAQKADKGERALERKTNWVHSPRVVHRRDAVAKPESDLTLEEQERVRRQKRFSGLGAAGERREPAGYAELQALAAARAEQQA